MTGYLLDTSAMLWTLTEPVRLGPAARHREPLLAPRRLGGVGLGTLHQTPTGKAPTSRRPAGRLHPAPGSTGRPSAAGGQDHALLAGRLEWEHRDPFDRMLAAQAMIESLVIINGDVAFAGCPGVPTLW